MIHPKQILRESFGDVPETCPAVDDAFATAVEKVKEQTGLLRDALNQWIERALEAEKRVEELEDEIESLKERVEA